MDDKEFTALIRRVARRDKKARTFLDEVHQSLPEGLEGVVVVNADTNECFHAEDKEDGWEKARRLYGEGIAYPPIWMIILILEKETPPPP